MTVFELNLDEIKNYKEETPKGQQPGGFSLNLEDIKNFKDEEIVPQDVASDTTPLEQSTLGSQYDIAALQENNAELPQPKADSRRQEGEWATPGSYIESAARGFASATPSVVASQAKMLNADKTSDALKQAGAYVAGDTTTDKKYQGIKRFVDGEFWKDPNGAARWVGETAGTLSTYLGETMALNKAIGAAIPATLASTIGSFGGNSQWLQSLAAKSGIIGTLAAKAIKPAGILVDKAGNVTGLTNIGQATLKGIEGATAAVLVGTGVGGEAELNALAQGMNANDAKDVAWDSFKNTVGSSLIAHAILPNVVVTDKSGQPMRVPLASATAFVDGLVITTELEKSKGHKVGNVLKPWEWTDEQLNGATEFALVAGAITAGVQIKNKLKETAPGTTDENNSGDDLPTKPQTPPPTDNGTRYAEPAKHEKGNIENGENLRQPKTEQNPESKQDSQTAKTSNNSQTSQTEIIKKVLANVPTDKVEYSAIDENGNTVSLDVTEPEIKAFVDAQLAGTEDLKAVENAPEGKVVYEFTNRGNKYYAVINMENTVQSSEQQTEQPAAKPQEQPRKTPVNREPPSSTEIEEANKLAYEGLREQAPKVRTDTGAAIPIAYDLVDLRDVVASNDPYTFSKNEEYPQELQPRDRSGFTMRDEVIKRAEELDPSRVLVSDMVNTGAPIVMQKGNKYVVLNGNGRMMSLQRVLNDNREKASEYMTAIANTFFQNDPQGALERLKSSEPKVLVRVALVKGHEDEIPAIINSTAGGMNMSAAETAKSDAQLIDESTWSFYQPNEQGDIESAENREFIRRLLGKIIENNPNLRQQLYPDGQLSYDGKKRAQNAVVAYAYQDDHIISRFANGIGEERQNIVNGLLRAAPDIARMRGEIQRFDRQDLNFVPDLLDACRKIGSFDNNKAIETYLNEAPLAGFEDGDISAFAKEIMKTLWANRRSGKTIGSFIRAMANAVANQIGEDRGVGLFGDEVAAVDKNGIYNAAIAFAIDENKESDVRFNTSLEGENNGKLPEVQQDQNDGRTDGTHSGAAERTSGGEEGGAETSPRGNTATLTIDRGSGEGTEEVATTHQELAEQIEKTGEVEKVKSWGNSAADYLLKKATERGETLNPAETSDEGPYFVSAADAHNLIFENPTLEGKAGVNFDGNFITLDNADTAGTALQALFDVDDKFAQAAIDEAEHIVYNKGKVYVYFKRGDKPFLVYGDVKAKKEEKAPTANVKQLTASIEGKPIVETIEDVADKVEETKFPKEVIELADTFKIPNLSMADTNSIRRTASNILDKVNEYIKGVDSWKAKEETRAKVGTIISDELYEKLPPSYDSLLESDLDNFTSRALEHLIKSPLTEDKDGRKKPKTLIEKILHKYELHGNNTGNVGKVVVDLSAKQVYNILSKQTEGNITEVIVFRAGATDAVDAHVDELKKAAYHFAQQNIINESDKPFIEVENDGTCDIWFVDTDGNRWDCEFEDNGTVLNSVANDTKELVETLSDGGTAVEDVPKLTESLQNAKTPKKKKTVNSTKVSVAELAQRAKELAQNVNSEDSVSQIDDFLDSLDNLVLHENGASYQKLRTINELNTEELKKYQIISINIKRAMNKVAKALEQEDIALAKEKAALAKELNSQRKAILERGGDGNRHDAENDSNIEDGVYELNSNEKILTAMELIPSGAQYSGEFRKIEFFPVISPDLGKRKFDEYAQKSNSGKLVIENGVVSLEVYPDKTSVCVASWNKEETLKPVPFDYFANKIKSPLVGDKNGNKEPIKKEEVENGDERERGGLQGLPQGKPQSRVQAAQSGGNSGQSGRGEDSQSGSTARRTGGTHDAGQAGVSTDVLRDDSEGNGERRTVQVQPVRRDDGRDGQRGRGLNYTITEADNLGEGGKKTKYKNNIVAIKLLRQLQSENRMAIAEEQKVLAKYVGWGAIPEVFDWRERKEWEKEQKELEDLLTPEEYRHASSSTQNAHYTSPQVIKAIWKTVERMGFKGGRVLEPAVGTGNFFGAMPEELRNKSDLRGVELDTITGGIAQQLYQGVNIDVIGFEQVKFPDNFFDVAISNIPFGEYKLYDEKYKGRFNIHNYFFAKSVDKVRPGGLIAFITSTGTLNSNEDARKLREMLDKKVDFLGAVALPNTTFQSNAGTSVTTHVVFLRKLADGEAHSQYHNDNWLNTHIETTKNERGYDVSGSINDYFAAHPEMAIGKLTANTMYGSNGGLALDGRGINVVKEFEDRLQKLPSNVYTKSQRAATEKKPQVTFLAPAGVRDNSYVRHSDGIIYQNKDGQMTPVVTNKGVISDFVDLKYALNDILSAQISPNITDAVLAEKRQKLNDAYDTFVKHNGYVNAGSNSKKLALDPEYGKVASIEYYRVNKKTKQVTTNKGDIFTKRTVQPVVEATSADNIVDAYALSLTHKGAIDVPYIAKLMNIDVDEAVKQLGDKIFTDPMTGEYVASDIYLSGNVREKLEQAEAAAKGNKAFGRNVEELKKVQPQDLTSDDISVQLGTPWIPADIVEEFADSLIAPDSYHGNRHEVVVKYVKATGEWVIPKGQCSWNAKNGVKATEAWGTKRKSFADLLDDCLNNREIVVKDKVEGPDGKDVYRINPGETTLAQAKAQEIHEAFQKWIWQDADRTKKLVDWYNRNFNNWVLRKYDGSFLNIKDNGFNHEAPDLREHQLDAIWRIIQEPNTLLAHCVGAGKTWTMQTAAMELKRLGLANKQMFVLPKNIIKQFEKEWYAIYPNAKLLVISSDYLPDIYSVPAKTTKQYATMSKAEYDKAVALARARNQAKRQKALAEIATGDWDGIIISHNLFKRVPLSAETVNQFFQEQINEMKEAIKETDDKISVKNLEKKIASLQAKMSKAANLESKDVAIPFEQLGIDRIYVDEADLFKNLGYTTRITRVAGLPNSDSQRAMDMFMKTHWLSKHDGGTIFATGTPISNTLAEMFTMQRYLGMDDLQEHGLGFFDAWVSSFANKVQTEERSPDGNGYRVVTKFAEFKNMPELQIMFHKFADVVTKDNLEGVLDIPKLKTQPNGEPGVTIVEIPINPELEQFIKVEAAQRADDIHKGRVKPEVDNMLKLTGDLRKASLDMRLVKPSIPAAAAGQKIDAVVNNIWRIYNETKDVKGTQLVFCDLSVPKAKKGADNESEENEFAEDDVENISVYDEIKKRLIKLGMPPEEVRFIHEAKTDDEKQELFEATRDGDIRVLIGSTEKMGAGTNCQDHLVALHHVDAPWRPRDIEQREGRILRQGNHNKEVEILIYVTKGSFDANMWEKLKNKADMINRLMSGDLSNRIITDAGENVLTFAEVEALASGDPLMKEKTELDTEYNRLSVLEKSFRHASETLKRELTFKPERIKAWEDQIQRAEEDIKANTFDNEHFKVEINGKTYTERTEARKAFEKGVQGLEKSESQTLIVLAHIGGFLVQGKYVPPGSVVFGKDGKGYTSTKGAVQVKILGKSNTYFPNGTTLDTAINAIEREPQRLADEGKTAIEHIKSEIKATEEQLAKGFQYKDELERVAKRREEIAAIFANREKKNAVAAINDSIDAGAQLDVDGAMVDDEGDEVQTFNEPQLHENAANYSTLTKPAKDIDRTSPEFHKQFNEAMQGALTKTEIKSILDYFDQHRGSSQETSEYLAAVDGYRFWRQQRESYQGAVFGKLWQKVYDYAKNNGISLEVEAEKLYNMAVKESVPIATDKKKLKTSIQLTLDFEAGEGNIQTAPNGLFSVDGSLRGDRGPVLHNITVKGFGFTRELVEEKCINLTGRTIHSARELATMAQVLRHPGYEKLHRIFVDEDGKILEHQTISCGLPDTCSSASKEEQKNGFVVVAPREAKKVYYVHNHPSGDPTPSRPDCELTKQLTQIFKDLEVEHIVLDTDRYALVRGNGHYVFRYVPVSAQIKYDTPSVQHKALMDYVTSDSVAGLVKYVESGKDTVFFLDAYNRVRSVLELPDNAFMNGNKYLSDQQISDYLRSIARTYYGNKAVIVTDNIFTYTVLVKTMQMQGGIVDVIYAVNNQSKGVASANGQRGNSNKWFGREHNTRGNGIRVLETGTPYNDKDSALSSVISSPTPKGWRKAFADGGVKGLLEHAYDELYTDFIDKYHYIDKYDKARNARKGEKLLDKIQMVGALTSGYSTALIEGSKESLNVVAQQINAKLHDVTLKDVLSVIDAKEMDKLYPDYLSRYGKELDWMDMFARYLVWRRLLEMSELHDQAYVAECVEWKKKVTAYQNWVNAGKPESARPEKPGAVPKYKPYKLPNELEEQDLRDGIKDAPEEFERAANLFYLWNDNILTILEQGNIISAATHLLLNMKYKNYCSLMRDFSEESAFDDYIAGLSNGGRGIANVHTTLKRISLEGSERLTLNPLEVAIKACAVAVNRAERNKVALMAVNQMGPEGLVTPVAGTASPDPQRCIFTVMEEGKVRAYKCVPELYEPITQFNQQTGGWFFDSMSLAARMLRTGATISPSFTVRNFFLDTMQAGIMSKNGFIPIVDSLRGAIMLLNDKQLAAEYEAMGISSFNFYVRRGAAEKTLHQLTISRNVSWKDALDVFQRAFGAEDFSAFIEAATRAGEFYLARKHGKSLFDAALEARRLTIDFSRSGRLGQQINKYIPFFNATLQGTDINLRAVTGGIKALAEAIGGGGKLPPPPPDAGQAEIEDHNDRERERSEERKQKLRVLANILRYAILPALALYVLTDEEPWYEDLDPAVKYTNWVLPNKIMVPMSQEWGLYASFALASIDYVKHNDKRAYKEWRNVVRSTIMPNLLPTMYLPVIEDIANYSFWTGKPLANQRLMKLPPELRAYASTSKLSKWFGKQTGIPPVIIDNTIRGYGGTMGTFLWGEIGDLAYWISREADSSPAQKLSEGTFLRGFNVTDYKLRRYSDEFMQIVEQANEDAKKDKKERIVSKKDAEKINKLNREITDLYKINREISSGVKFSKHTPEFKRNIIDRNNEKIRVLSKQGTKEFGDKINH